MAPPKLGLICTIEGCGLPHLALGYCQKHYTRVRKYGDPHKVVLKQLHGLSLADRWAAYVGERGAGCWEWTGFRDPNGYGRLNVGNVPKLAHRISWELHYGHVAPEDHILHRCDNPPCIRPDHLFKGDHALNMADKMAKKRHRYGVTRGEAHPRARLTESQVAEIRASSEASERVGSRYGISGRNVRDIRNRKSWRHVP